MKLKQDGVGIGANLKRLRLSKGYSQSKLVTELHLLGFTYITCDIYKKMEQNRYNIRISELIALQLLFNVSYDDFFKDLTINNLLTNYDASI